jgi:RNA polymerase sigma-70 factor (ECF subfamily)
MKEDIQTELVQAAQSGNIESFGRLCSHYYTPMVALAYSVLLDHHLAEDVVQEAYARALTSLPKLKKAEKFAPWLAQICRNVAIDLVRRGGRDAGSAQFALAPCRQNDDSDCHAVRQAISRLPAPDKELIVLKYYDGLSYEQISAVLGISGPAVNGRLTRAKRKLAKHLRRQGILEDRP